MKSSRYRSDSLAGACCKMPSSGACHPPWRTSRPILRRACCLPIMSNTPKRVLHPEPAGIEFVAFQPFQVSQLIVSS